MRFSLRPYQDRAVSAVLGAWGRGVRRPVILQATGTGKTVIFCEIASRLVREERRRPVILVHRDELVDQAVDKLASTDSGLSIGVIKAERHEVRCDVAVASVQTLVRRLGTGRKGVAEDRFTDLIIDECFPAGTMVGDREIQDLCPGDLVPSAHETSGEPCWRIVVRTMSKRPRGLVRLILSDGEEIVCTPEHPFLTTVGWLPAAQLRGATVLRWHHDDAMRGMRSSGRHETSDQGSSRRLETVWSNVLLDHLPGHLGCSRRVAEDETNERALRLGAHEGEQSDGQAGGCGQDGRHASSRRELGSRDSRRKRPRDHRTATSSIGVPGLAHRGDDRSPGRLYTDEVRGRYSSPETEDHRRGGRSVASRQAQTPGCAPRRASGHVRVAHVQVLEPGGDGTYGGVCPGGLVYNLEVEETHTYRVGSGIVVHNCHHATASSYVSIMKHFGALPNSYDPRRPSASNEIGTSRALGVTATLARADNTPLGHIWQEVVFEYGTAQGIQDGFLVAPHAERAVIKDLDLSKVKSIGGDWSEGELGTQLFRSGFAIGEKLLEVGTRDGALRRTIVFAPTVACAGAWAEDFAALGIRCRVITGTTPKDERRDAYAATAAGRNDALISVMVLTEGFDLPSVEVAIIGRPTKSLPLYTQMVGRVLRPSPATGKTSALVLDVCGVMNEKLTTLVDLGLPPACGCHCDCDFEHLCPQLCRCPRTKKGKLCKPCIICKRAWMSQPRAERESCPHYVAGHVVGCQHRCEGLGKPGIHDDEDEELDLDPDTPEPKELLIDESDIETRSVELFDFRAGAWVPKVAPVPRAKQKSWRLTYGGIPYMPATSNFEYLVFLFEEEAGWTVGSKPSKGGGRAERIATGLSFPDAVEHAESEHPSLGRLGRPLQGDASEKQLGVLARAGIEIPKSPSRQWASEQLSDLFASRALDA